MEIVQVQQRTDLDLRGREIQLNTHAEMEHAYLTRFLTAPNLERLQMILAEALVRAAGLPPRVANTVIAALLLIYHGLAVHDEIETLTARDDERYRQLGVLAGDYYSSKYYRLLAEAGEIALIGQFARAVQQVNEARAELERDPSDFSLKTDRYQQSHETIQSALLHSLRVHYLPEQPQWAMLITHLVRAQIQSRELESASTHIWARTLPNLTIWQKASGEERKYLKGLRTGERADSRLLSLHVKYGTSSDLLQELDESLDLAGRTLDRMGEPLDDVRELCRQLTEYRPLPWRVVEEG